MTTHDPKQLRELIDRELSRRYIGHAFAFFYGSMSGQQARGTPNSDLDLIVVYDGEIQPFRQIFEADGLKFDVFVYDAETINYQIRRARSGGRAVLLTMVAEAEVLPQPHPLATYLKELATRVEAIPLPAPNTDAMRLAIGNMTDDLEYVTDRFERNSVIIDLYKSLSDLHLAQVGKRGHHRRHAARELARVAPVFLDRLNSAFALSQTHDDVGPMIALARETIDQFGGPVGDGYKAPLVEGRRLPVFDVKVKPFTDNLAPPPGR